MKLPETDIKFSPFSDLDEKLTRVRLRILVVDDNSVALEKLVSELNKEFDVVGTATNGSAALKVLRECDPDVVVTDLSMPGLNGIELAREILKDSSPPRVIICTVESDTDLIQAALGAGAFGFVFKRQLARDLVRAVKTVAHGDLFVSSS